MQVVTTEPPAICPGWCGRVAATVGLECRGCGLAGRCADKQLLLLTTTVISMGADVPSEIQMKIMLIINVEAKLGTRCANLSGSRFEGRINLQM